MSWMICDLIVIYFLVNFDYKHVPMLQVEDQTNDTNQETPKVPNYLIRDEFDGRSFYYK